MKLEIYLGLLVFVFGCNANPKKQSKMDSTINAYSYLALGDSYTIGESVPESERWPVQLAKELSDNGITVEQPRIIATTGWTTDELANAINETITDETYDLVSLLIGVNNQYRGYPFPTYEKEFSELLDKSISFAGNDPSRVFVVSIPDYGVTPFGQKKDPTRIAMELDQYNAKVREICALRSVTFINITDISKNALNDPSLVADDQLHPSGAMYTLWVERIYPEVKELFDNN